MNFSPDRKLWYTEQDSGIITFGLSKEFLNEHDDIFSFLPPSETSVNEKDPLIVIQSCSGLFSLLSPVAGYIKKFNNKAMDFPDQIKDTDWLVVLSTKVLPKAEKKIAVKKPALKPLALNEQALIDQMVQIQQINHNAQQQAANIYGQGVGFQATPVIVNPAPWPGGLGTLDWIDIS